MQLILIIVNFVLIEVGVIFASIGQHIAENPSKYDLEVEDLNEFCPLVPGFDEFDTHADSRSDGKDCYKYQWIPEPCTMEKSGRIESDLLHCGHYSMIPCTDADSRNNNMYDGMSGFDIPWEEGKDLCDVVKIKGRTTKKHKHLRPVYWKWTFCENDNGTELRPCGRYSMEFYHGKDTNLIH